MNDKPVKKVLDIGEVSRLTGLPPSTLRYYEEKGLIRSTSRHGLRRLFNSHVLEQLEFISLGQTAGLSLEDIGAMFTDEGRLQVNRQFLLAKAQQMERTIREMTAIRNTILHVAKCSAPNHIECPKFRRLLRVAGKRNPVARAKGRRATTSRR